MSSTNNESNNNNNNKQQAKASGEEGEFKSRARPQAGKKMPKYHRESDIGGFNSKAGGNVFSRNFSCTDPTNWAKNLRAQAPTLLQVGKPTPKAVLSFGGCGFLCTYSLGVVQYLLQDKKDFVRQCYIVGSGSGVIPAVALCAEECSASSSSTSTSTSSSSSKSLDIASPENIKNFICDNVFNIFEEDDRLKHLVDGLETFVPEDIASRMAGRCSLAVGLSNRDMNFFRQPANQQLFGAMISSFDDKKDVSMCIIAATAPNATMPVKFRGEPCTRATWKCLSSELDQYVRHIYIHGLSGYPYSSQHTRHNHFFGRHGFLANSHWMWQRQFLCAIAPTRIPFLKGMHQEMMREAFEKGYQDARRYERWEEDVYLTAKPDRTPNENLDLRTLRAALFGNRGGGDAGHADKKL